MRAVIVAVAFVLSGCATPTETFTGPDGRAAFTVACDSWGESIATCHEKARAQCAGNYDVINTVDDRRTLPSGVNVPERSLSYACKTT